MRMTGFVVMVGLFEVVEWLVEARSFVALMF